MNLKLRFPSALLAGLSIVGIAACGGTADTGSPSTPAGTSSVCKTTQSKPGYKNDLKVLANPAPTLSGAGGTFVAPLMSVWSEAYNKVGKVQVAYQAIGSGGGIKQIQAGTVDFGESDAYMKDDDIAKAKGPILQVPLTLAPVVAAYNLTGVKSGVKFDAETLGNIFAGKITKWNDPALVALNKGTTLPDLAIAVVHRSDGSGTTDIWTNFLTKESPSWVTALGGADKSRGKTVAWPTGIGGKGNDGVSAAIGQTPGAIGYVELAYAVQQNLTYANIKNKSGSFIEPCIATVVAATEGLTYPDDLRFDPVDAGGANAYPVTGTTWALIYQDQKDAAKAAALVNFFAWALSDGQDLTLGINYAPLGKVLRDKSAGQLKKVTLNGQPLVQ